ncbi:MAG: peptidoglycan DD-metalloendopeptidase family protein [Actinomycetota bacterium]
MRGNQTRFTRLRLTGYVVVLLALALTLATTSVAQIFPRPTPTPTPRRTPAPTPTPPPSVSPTIIPEPEEDTPIPDPTEDPNDTPRPKPTLSASPGVVDQKKNDELPPELDRPKLVVPNIARTRARNTGRLVDLLEPLTNHGLPLEQVLVEGMGRFPIAGVVWYRDDWLNPRYTPVPHLHKGLDMWADFGTPVRSPDNGVVSRLTNNPSGGGIGVWVRGTDGTQYYYAHLAGRVEGIFIGQRVRVGTVLGYVGDTGNAEGGPPHLHFEVHRGGPIPPKPSVDRWLDEAIELAPRWVRARVREIESKRGVLGGARAPGADGGRADLDASMLLTLLDPVGGSVGLLPRLQLAPVRRAHVSNGLMAELIRLRLDGYLFLPSSGGLATRD